MMNGRQGQWPSVPAGAGARGLNCGHAGKAKVPALSGIRREDGYCVSRKSLPTTHTNHVSMPEPYIATMELGCKVGNFFFSSAANSGKVARNGEI